MALISETRGRGVTGLFSAAARKAGAIKRNVKYHIDLIALRREIERLFSELGGRTFELLSQDPEAMIGRDPEVLEWMQQLQAYDERLHARKNEHQEVPPGE